MANRKETSKFREMSKLTKFAFWLSAISPLLVSWSITLCYQNRDYLMWGGINLENIKIFCENSFCLLFLLFSVSWAITCLSYLLADFNKVRYVTANAFL